MLYSMVNLEHPELALYPPGACVYLVNNKYVLSDKRLIPNAFILNEDKEIASKGDVSVYTLWPAYMYNAGQLLCSGPGGLIDFVREKEADQFPNTILGTVIQPIDHDHLLIHLNT